MARLCSTVGRRSRARHRVAKVTNPALRCKAHSRHSSATRYPRPGEFSRLVRSTRNRALRPGVVAVQLAVLTVIGLIVNRLRPQAMQRARLDVVDKPLRMIPPLPGTEITPVALPHCTARDEASA
jgi:hypothetical protein